jgi:5'-3' exonuclease
VLVVRFVVVAYINFDNIGDSFFNNLFSINFYINLIEPTDNIYIAFDGVSPIAKLDQQRQRRYKSYYQSKVFDKIYNDNNLKPKWNTTAITPGTEFMKKLNKKIEEYFYSDLFLYKYYKNTLVNIYVSV